MLHGIGIGALGTLTLVMMARTTALRTRKPFVDFGDIGIAALLLSAAALARIIASVIPAEQSGFLWLAAGAWISAFLLLLVRLWRTVWYANVSPNMYRIRAAANCAFRASQLIRIALITL